MSPRQFALCGAAALSLALAAPCAAHDKGAHDGHGAAAVKPAAGVRLRLADTPLVDQDGREVRLRSELLGKRVAVVNFVYTTCTTVCPVASATLAQLQRRLGDRAGERVLLVSITVDPLRDTPARLREYAARHEAGPGWRWLTGRKADVDAALKAFGAYTPNPEDHPNMTLVGDAESGQWTRLYGFTGVDELLAQVERALGVPVARRSH
ncbi:MAG TPA: SCO family protein [Burkholderiales bacterium]